MAVVCFLQVRQQLERLQNDQQDIQNRLLKTAGLLVQAQAYGKFKDSIPGISPDAYKNVIPTGGQSSSVMDSNPLFAL